MSTSPVASRLGRSSLLNAPNLLSLSRVVLAPMFIWLLTDPGAVAGIVAAFAFALACYSDWLDGHLARTRGQTTNLGKLLDPLADKILILSALIMLCAMPREPRIPAWIVALIAVREVAVTGLPTGQVIQAHGPRRTKMAHIPAAAAGSMSLSTRSPT